MKKSSANAFDSVKIAAANVCAMREYHLSDKLFFRRDNAGGGQSLIQKRYKSPQRKNSKKIFLRKLQ
jgi:hypothetical protein